MTDTQGLTSPNTIDIPREAVDAAARALGNHIELDFDVLPADEQHQAREAAVAALNAATPLIVAAATGDATAIYARVCSAELVERLGRDGLERLVREVLAAVRKSGVDEPAEPQPESLGRIARVWSAGDPEPEDAPAVRDAMGDVWTRRESNGLWYAPDTAPFTWEHIAKKWSPLTEVLDVKAGV